MLIFGYTGCSYGFTDFRYCKAFLRLFLSCDFSKRQPPSSCLFTLKSQNWAITAKRYFCKKNTVPAWVEFTLMNLKELKPIKNLLCFFLLFKGSLKVQRHIFKFKPFQTCFPQGGILREGRNFSLVRSRKFCTKEHRNEKFQSARKIPPCGKQPSDVKFFTCRA